MANQFTFVENEDAVNEFRDVCFIWCSGDNE